MSDAIKGFDFEECEGCFGKDWEILPYDTKRIKVICKSCGNQYRPESIRIKERKGVP